MAKLDVRHLLMLRAIAGADSLQEAARTLSITQSALSHRLREAERRLDAALIVRSKGIPALTAAGQKLLTVALRVLEQLDSVEREVAGGERRAPVTVRLGASTLSGYQWLPGVMKRLDQGDPPIELEVVLDVSLDPISALRRRALDIAVVPAAIRHGTLSSLQLFRDEMVALLPAQHALASKSWLEVADIVSQTYVADDTSAETGREYERLFKPARVRPRRILRAGLTEAVVALVRAGLGITILTRRNAAPYLAARDLTAVRVTRRGLFVDWHAVLRTTDFKDSAPRMVAEALRDVVRVES